MKSNSLITFLATLWFLSPSLQSENEDASDLEAFLQQLTEDVAIPSIAAAVVSPTELLDAAAHGVRKNNESTSVTLNDRYHLGSCTKTMTATLAAILVDEGLIEWDSTIGEILGDTLPQLHQDFHEVTLEQLLAHVGGLSTQPPSGLWLQAWGNQGKLDPRSQRLAFISPLLSLEPQYMPGSRNEYSNQGYAVAGIMLETVADTPWETLITEKLFAPLHMESAGFRAPASPGMTDQPWGHRRGNPVPPEPAGDNPDAIGPAATVHASITDWAKFAQYHLSRDPTPLVEKQSSLDKLHSTLPNSGQQGVGGWLVHDIESLGGHCLQMVGSNTMWYSLFWVIPERDIAIVATTNTGDPRGFEILDQVAAFLIQKYAK